MDQARASAADDAAVHYVDRRALREVPFPHYLGDETDPNPVRRGYPGDPNERRTVGLIEVDSGALQLLDLPDPTGSRVVDFSWSTDGRLLLFYRLNLAMRDTASVFRLGGDATSLNSASRSSRSNAGSR